MKRGDWHDFALELAQIGFGNEIETEAHVDATRSSLYTMHDLFLEITRKMRIRDDWLEPKSEVYPLSIGVYEFSDKIFSNFSLGLDYQGVYASSTIQRTERIQNASDEFRNHIIHLSKLGKAVLEDQGRPVDWGADKHTARMLKFNNSLVYSIARDYVLLNQVDDYRSVGCIRISFPIDSPKEEMLEFFSEAVFHFHKMNYLLYRLSYLFSKAKRSY